jgi:hypothetical protein
MAAAILFAVIVTGVMVIDALRAMSRIDNAR